MEVVAARDQTLFRRTITGRYLSPACEPPRCADSLVVMWSENTSRVLLVPAEGGVMLMKILVGARNEPIFEFEEDAFVPLLQGCSPVHIQSFSDEVYILCVQQARIILVRLNVAANTQSLAQSSLSGQLNDHSLGTLSCLSNIEQSAPDELVFSLCGQIVAVKLGMNTFRELEQMTCPSVLRLISPPGHTDTLLVYCNTTTIYYDLDSEVIINMTSPQDPGIPSTCTDPAVGVTVFPEAGDIEYRLWTASCTQQLKVSSSKLLSWQCLGDRDQLLFAFTTNKGLFAAQFNFTDNRCFETFSSLDLATANCSGTNCRPLMSTVMGQYLVFQAGSGTAGSYQVSVFCAGTGTAKIAGVSHIDFRLITVLTYSQPSPLPTPSPTPLPTTTMLLPEGSLSGGVIAAIVLIGVLLPFTVIVIAGIVLGLIFKRTCTKSPLEGDSPLDQVVKYPMQEEAGSASSPTHPPIPETNHGTRTSLV